MANNFALTPGLYEDEVIDYGTPDGVKLYRAAVKALGPELFDCDPEGMRLFMVQIQARVIEAGWEPLIQIPTEDGAVNLITNYGEIELEDIQEHAATYVDQATRVAQLNHQMYQCLLASLSREGLAKVTMSEEDYLVEGYFSGPCMLKVILRESHIDTRATVRHVREELSSLDVAMVKYDHDIIKLNMHVKALRRALHSRGEEANDMVTNLFKGYKAAADPGFVAYIQKKEDAYDEGEDITADKLMVLAANKYKTLVEQKQWNAPSKAEEKIIALETKIQELTKLKRDAIKAKKTRTGKPDWMSKEPKGDEPHTKMMEGKEFHWCKKHRSWGRHKPSDCRGVGANRQADQSTSPTTEGTTNASSTSPELRISNALQAVMEEDSE